MARNANTVTEKVSKKSSEEVRTAQSSAGVWLFLFVVVFGALIGYQQKEIYDLKQSSATFNADLQQNIEQSIKQDVAQMRKVYIYNLEETLRGIKLESFNREFEAKLNVLNEEVSVAQEKISSLEDTKDKDTFSDIYLKSLKLKRDTMIQEYNHTLEDLTEQINQAITEIAKEKNASVILDRRAVASLTEDVEDVTDEVVKKVKLLRPKTMDE